jgi:hypothetical protein
MNDVRTLKSVVDEGLDGFVGVFVPEVTRPSSI